MSNKRPIAWYEKCLANMINTHHRLEATIEEKRDEADRLWAECAWLRVQIVEAKRRGKDGFDADRFMMEKGKPALPAPDQSIDSALGLRG